MSVERTRESRTHRSGSVAEVFAAFLKLGLSAFGGPIALLGFSLLVAWRVSPLLVVASCVLARVAVSTFV